MSKPSFIPANCHCVICGAQMYKVDTNMGTTYVCPGIPEVKLVLAVQGMIADIKQFIDCSFNFTIRSKGKGENDESLQDVLVPEKGRDRSESPSGSGK